MKLLTYTILVNKTGIEPEESYENHKGTSSHVPNWKAQLQKEESR